MLCVDFVRRHDAKALCDCPNDPFADATTVNDSCALFGFSSQQADVADEILFRLSITSQLVTNHATI